MSKAIAFIAGLGTGYMNAQQRERDRARQDEMDKITKDRAAREQADWDQQQADKRAMRDAAAPATIEEGAGGMLRSPTMDNRDVGLPENAALPDGGLTAAPYRVNGTSFATKPEAAAAADAYNKPEAQAQRVLTAQRGIDFTKSLQTEQAMQGIKTGKIQLDAAQMSLEEARRTNAKKIIDEGLLDAHKALLRGDAAGVKEAFNKAGVFKIDGDVTITPRERDVPGIGKIKTYDATATTIGPDGKPRTDTINSHDLGVQLFSYKDQLDLLAKGKASDDKAAYQAGLLDAKARQIELAGQLAAARIEAANAKAAQVGAAPVWNKEADAELLKLHTAKDETTGRTTLDGDGLQFTKFIAVNKAMLNGGNTVSAIGYAADVDNRLRQQAGNDPEKLRVLRATALQSLMTAPGSPGAAPTTPAGKAVSVAPPGSVVLQNGQYVPQQQAAPAAAGGIGGALTEPNVYDRSGRAQADVLADQKDAERAAMKIKAESDPEIVALRNKRAQLAKSGDPRQINSVVSQIQQIMQQRYGL